MKKKFSILKALPLFLLTLAVVGIAAFGLPALFAVMYVGSAGAAVGVVVEGTVTTEKVDTASPGLNKNYISKKITEMRPASVPIDTIMRSVARTVPVRSMKTEYYAVDIKPLKDVTTLIYTNPGAAKTAAVKVGNISLWNVDDTVLIPNTVGGNGKPLVGCVTSRDIATQTITIQALNGTGAGTDVVPNIPLSSIVVRMAPAKSELDLQTSPFAVIPEKEYNYCQNAIAQVEESTFQKIQDQEVDWDFSDYESLNIYDMRARKEISALAGVRRKFVDANDNEVKYTMGGFNQYITKGLTWSIATGVRDADFVNWTKKLFQDNSGSDSRFAFIGDDLMESMSLITTIQKQMDSKNTDVKWGITFNVIETNFGKLYVKRHPLFRMMGWDKNGMILDVNNLEHHVHTNLKTTEIDLIKSGQRNANAKVLQEVDCYVMRYPDTHAFISATA